MEKLWGGRFSKSTGENLDEFNASISVDKRMYKQDIDGSIAHVKMLARQGIIGSDESEKIIYGLNQILSDIEENKINFSKEYEDIHMNIEKILIDRIGEVGKKLHTGRSRNDQVALDLRLYLRDENIKIRALLTEFLDTLVSIASANINVVMPGYTHLQPAQPVLFSHHIMAYFDMFYRDVCRLEDFFKRLNICPLGSGALAGTTYPLDRNFVASELGFAGITSNSLDGVSDRDFVAEMCFACSAVMMHLSRFSEEIVIWSTSEFGFIILDDAFSTGSSIMPQKKNPDIAELARGKTGRVYGNLISILTVMKALPLAYNKDMQEDKEAVFDSCDTVCMCLPIFSDMLKTMTVCEKRMRERASCSFTNATDLADYLVKKGMAFRDAHKICGRIVSYCIENDKHIQGLTIEEIKEFSDVFESDFYDEISIESCIDKRLVDGATATCRVLSAIEDAEKICLRLKNNLKVIKSQKS